jgi:hypothetical protein
MIIRSNRLREHIPAFFVDKEAATSARIASLSLFLRQ